MYSSQFPLSQFHFSFLFLISFISFSGFVFALGCDFLLHFSTFLYAFLVVSCFVFRGQERVFFVAFRWKCAFTGRFLLGLFRKGLGVCFCLLLLSFVASVGFFHFIDTFEEMM